MMHAHILNRFPGTDKRSTIFTPRLCCKKVYLNLQSRHGATRKTKDEKATGNIFLTCFRPLQSYPKEKTRANSDLAATDKV